MAKYGAKIVLQRVLTEELNKMEAAGFDLRFIVGTPDPKKVKVIFKKEVGPPPPKKKAAVKASKKK